MKHSRLKPQDSARGSWDAWARFKPRFTYVAWLYFYIFWSAKTSVSMKPTWPMTLPLCIFGVLSLGWLGAIQGPLLDTLGSSHNEVDIFVYLIASAIPIIGLLLAYVLYKKTKKAKKASVFGFDILYRTFLIKPYIILANLLKNDLFTTIYLYLGNFVNLAHSLLSKTQTGRIGQYLGVVVASALTVIGFWCGHDALIFAGMPFCFWFFSARFKIPSSLLSFCGRLS